MCWSMEIHRWSIKTASPQLCSDSWCLKSGVWFQFWIMSSMRIEVGCLYSKLGTIKLLHITMEMITFTYKLLIYNFWHKCCHICSNFYSYSMCLAEQIHILCSSAKIHRSVIHRGGSSAGKSCCWWGLLPVNLMLIMTLFINKNKSL